MKLGVIYTYHSPSLFSIITSRSIPSYTVLLLIYENIASIYESWWLHYISSVHTCLYTIFIRGFIYYEFPFSDFIFFFVCLRTVQSFTITMCISFASESLWRLKLNQMPRQRYMNVGWVCCSCMLCVEHTHLFEQRVVPWIYMSLILI